MSVLKLKDENGNWIGVPSIKGEAGATPHIGENGNWWIGNIDTNIQAQGDSGVYTGSGDAPENYDIQIDLDGEPLLYDPVAATKDMTSPVGVDNEGKLWASSTPDLSGYVTDAELENALANIPTGGGEIGKTAVLTIELSESVSMITQTLTAEQAEKIRNAKFLFLDVLANSEPTETTATAKGKYTIRIDSPNTTGMSAYLANKQEGIPPYDWRSWIYNRFVFMWAWDYDKNAPICGDAKGVLLIHSTISNSNGTCTLRETHPQGNDAIVEGATFVFEATQMLGAGSKITIAV